MDNNYKVKVNKLVEFILTKEDITSTDIVKGSDQKYHILQNNQSVQAEIVQSDFNAKNYTVKVNNTNYQVNIQNELDELISEMGFTIGKVKIINSIKAPMPGLVLEVNVKVGDSIKEEDSLLILEAMKMENSITSPRDGVIKVIAIQKGDAVDKGELLIEFE